MLTRILNSKLPLIVYNPTKVFSLQFFTEIFKAGGLPVFDTEFMSREEIMDGVKTLMGEDILFGLRLVRPDQTLIDDLKLLASAKLDTIVMPMAKGGTTLDFSLFSDTKLILEIKDININEDIKAADPHALILKGNEAGGRVSNYSSFILMQWYLKNSNIPLFIHGGIGRNTAPGMFAAGVSGIVLDSQLWLSEESPVADNFKKLLAALDESDSIEITTDRKCIFRVFAKLGTKIVKDLKERAIIMSNGDNATDLIYKEIKDGITPIDKADAQAVQSLFFLGQDALFAKDFAGISPNISQIIPEFFKETGLHLNLVDQHDPIIPDSPLARDHNTTLPLIQGPMANVSDNADFANKVLEAGALPFFAVGSLPESLADAMLEKGANEVKNFGAGLVGIEAFNPSVNEHLEMVKKYKVPFALFAGGVPSQVIELEKSGTKTYLHTPSISMMENAIKSGCRRFIFEGKEAGGHIGSLSSLVLWDAAISKLLKKYDDTLHELTLVFAGGISTCFASCFISGMTSILAAKGIKIAMQVGSAYLFAEEIVETKSIKPQYQKIICEEQETMVIGNSVGLASRTAPTEFARKMIEQEKEMIRKGEKLEVRKRSFEKNNIGSLLIGAKGFLPDFKRSGPEYYIHFKEEEQVQKGNYLVGDSLAFFQHPLPLKDIHTNFFDAKDMLFRNLGLLEVFSSEKNAIHDEIAIIGMGCILPGAMNPEILWENILGKKYSIKEMPQSRLRRELYYDPDRNGEDKTYTILAGIIDDYTFDREKFGYDDKKAAKLSRSQQLLLETAYQAVEDAGYLTDDMRFGSKDPERTAVIIATCLGNELGNELQLKYHFPEVLSMVRKTDAFKALNGEDQKTLTQALQKGMEGANVGYDPVHGMLLNIEASRIARHLGIRGTNYIVDAACASSFSALDAAMGELLSGSCDEVVIGGVNTHLAPESFVGFCKMGALSEKGSFPFDERAGGFILGEGSGVFVLKRVKDAIRDGNRIHAVIKGIGSSSDGRGKAIAAPNVNGQILALERCYDNMEGRVAPEDIGFIEAHGTSTIMGDQAELETLKKLYNKSKTGISSIKSQIGHLLGGAGAAGLIKAVLSVEKGIKPPNANFEKLSDNHHIEDTPLYIITEPEPWEEKEGKTRKAGVSSYGFGGINYHLVIEASTPNYKALDRRIFADPGYDFNDDRIVIAGIGVCLPGAPNTEMFWKALESGEKQLGQIPEERFDNSVYAEFDKNSIFRLPMVKAGVIRDFKFNNIKYRMPPTIVRSLERGQLFGLDAADEAIQSSGLADLLVHGNRTGVILGTIPGERQTKNILRVRKELIGEIIENAEGLSPEKTRPVAAAIVEAIRKRIPENNEDTTPGLLSNIISGRIANHFGLNGANYVVDASCASSVIAINNAIRSLSFKELDFALAGGVDANLYPAVLMAFKRLGLLSEGEARFFDDRADGYSMGEGAAIHVLTTYRKAKESGMEILGEINGCAIKSSVPDHLLSPSEHTFVSTINACYLNTGIRKKEINHLDLFAFSNILGDMIEKQVVEKAFDHEMYCGNVKPQFGYFKAANPAVAMAKLALMNKNRKLLPNFNFDSQHSTLRTGNILKSAGAVITPPDNAPLRFAFNVNGIGGNHCHMILSTLPAMLQKSKSALKIPGEIQASTKASEEALKEQSEPFAAASIKKSSASKPVPEHDPLRASSSQREPLQSNNHIEKNTQSASISPRPEKVKRLAKASMGTPPVIPPDGSRHKMVALLSGQGAQSPGMMKALFDHDPDIRNTMKRGEEIFVQARGYSLLELMFWEDQRLNLTENTQPAVFLSSAALFDRLGSDGFNPDCFIGHSVGEYTALFCSGMLNFDDAMKLIIKRSDLMKEAADKYPGKIMVVFRNEKETSGFIRDANVSGVYITNKNSENQTAVSGDARAIEDFCEFLTSKNVLFKKLNLSGAFHTPLFREAAESLREYLATITFNEVPFGRVISNVTATPYPEDRRAVKDLLAKQITSPVEFIRSVESVYESGRTHFIEIGPGRLLANLLKNINIAEYQSIVTVDIKQGELESFEACREYLKTYSSIFTRTRPLKENILPKKTRIAMALKDESFAPAITVEDDFEDFKLKNLNITEKLLYEEYLRQKREAAMEAVERFNFTTDKILISGVSVGLPGKSKRVFDKDNFNNILEGHNFIEPLVLEDQLRMTDKNITRLFKQPDGNARFVEITRTEDVIHLAGQLGYFSLTDEYGIKAQYDISMALAVAAGIEALKDAGIPLVMQYKKSSTGDRMIPDGFALPKEMQDETGVIITSLFPSNETLIDEMEKYFYDRLYLKPYEEFENIYFYLMEHIKDTSVKEEITDWFFKIKERKRKDIGPYKFDRNFMTNACPLGSAHLAQIIRAKGPNTLISSACASTTQAIGIAEDWIRVGRCKRMVIIGGENATSHAQNQWIGSGFLALGAATVKKRVSEAAKPFDAERNGTILGSGAVGLIVEKESRVRDRGMRGQAEVLGTHMANSAFHTFNIDVSHMSSEMKKFITKVEQQHKMKQEDYAKKLLFMSHETYTPARGGSADAEVTALKTTFSRHLNDICISNTKGFTGHTLGAAIEDVVMIKALQKRQAPPIANLTNIPEHFRELNFSSKKAIDAEYGLHLAAGFGSHIAFLFIKRIEENSFKNNPAYTRWLQEISGAANPELKIIDNTLCVVDSTTPGAVPVIHGEELKNLEIQPVQPQPANIEMVKPAANIEMVKPAEINHPGVKAVAATKEGDSALVSSADKAPELQSGSIPVSSDSIPVSNVDSSLPHKETSMAKVKEIIAEQTGYTTDMLEEDLDLEADLGIDTVKQVEIFAKSAGHFGFPVPEDLKLRDLNTIEKLAGYIDSKISGSMPAASPEPQQGPAHGSPESGETPYSEAENIPSGESEKADNAATAGQDSALPAPGSSKDKVKEIIAEQTGYTTDMLDEDLDLEADLGIDTVKQVEIFAKSASHFGFPVPEDLKLRDLNTIEKLAAYIDATLAGPKDTPPAGGGGHPKGQTPAAKSATKREAGPVSSAFQTPGEKISAPALNLTENIEADTLNLTPSGIKRLVPVISKTNIPVTEQYGFNDKTIIMTIDGYGFSEAVAREIKAHNGTVIGISESDDDPAYCDITMKYDLSSDEAAISSIKDIMENITLEKNISIDGFIHLAPIDIYFSRNEEGENKGESQVESFFLLIKEMFPQLNKKDSLIAALSFDSVLFPYGQPKGGIEPCFAGISGMMKSIAKEMPDTRVKMVDFSHDTPLASIDEISSLFIGEITSMDPRVETGYSNGKKFVLKLVERPVDHFDDSHEQLIARSAPSPGQADSENLIRQGDTLLVTGGARGITFEILKKVVEEYSTNLIIMARSPIDDIDEDFLEDEVDEAYIMRTLRGIMKGVKPVVLKNETTRIMGIRESRKNIEALKSQGVEVAYIATDVADRAAVTAALNNIDHVDGVIHAAGIEESMPFDKKEFSSFSKVFNTKVKGCANVIRALKGKGVRFHVGFSSVTAKFGNEGQADYTAANDMMAKILFKEQAQAPNVYCKVMDWTAWSGKGMATRETVKKVLTERGLKFLPLKEGINFFMDEIRSIKPSEVVITGLDRSFDRDSILDIAPFLAAVETISDKETVFSRHLNIEKDRFLLDHAMEGTPIFLGATGVEAMAEAAMAAVNPGQYDVDEFQITDVRNFSIPYGIKLLRNKPKDIMVSVKHEKNTDEKSGEHISQCTITSQFINKSGMAMGAPKLHYQADIVVGKRKTGTEKIKIPPFSKIEDSETLAGMIYHPQRLFMDDLFRTIIDIVSFDGTTLITKMSDKSRSAFFTDDPCPAFLTDVVMLDAMFQTGGVFEFLTDSSLVLPYKIGSLKFYEQGIKDHDYLCITTRTSSDEETDTFDIDLVDEAGKCLMVLKYFQMVKLHKLPETLRINTQVSMK